MEGVLLLCGFIVEVQMRMASCTLLCIASVFHKPTTTMELSFTSQNRCLSKWRPAGGHSDGLVAVARKEIISSLDLRSKDIQKSPGAPQAVGIVMPAT